MKFCTEPPAIRNAIVNQLDISSYLSGLHCHLRTKRADIALMHCPVSGSPYEAWTGLCSLDGCLQPVEHIKCCSENRGSIAYPELVTLLPSEHITARTRRSVA